MRADAKNLLDQLQRRPRARRRRRTRGLFVITFAVDAHQLHHALVGLPIRSKFGFNKPELTFAPKKKQVRNAAPLAQVNAAKSQATRELSQWLRFD